MWENPKPETRMTNQIRMTEIRSEELALNFYSFGFLV